MAFYVSTSLTRRSHFESVLIIGFLSRYSEKLIESRTLLSSIPYSDRLDYVSCVCQEEAFYSTPQITDSQSQLRFRLLLPLLRPLNRVIILRIIESSNHQSVSSIHLAASPNHAVQNRSSLNCKPQVRPPNNSVTAIG